MKRPDARTVSLMLVLGVAACASAGGTVKGGEPAFDAAAPEVTAATGCIIGADAGSGTTWTDLYRDFFGPNGAGSCVGNGTCHGDPSKPGSSASKFVCEDKDACRASMVSEESGLVILPRDAADPHNSGLVQELRRKNADGTVSGLMPKRPNCAFDTDAIARIETWIKNNAPND